MCLRYYYAFLTTTAVSFIVSKNQVSRKYMNLSDFIIQVGLDLVNTLKEDLKRSLYDGVAIMIFPICF